MLLWLLLLRLALLTKSLLLLLLLLYCCCCCTAAAAAMPADAPAGLVLHVVPHGGADAACCASCRPTSKQ
jgi:hypothetical protein